eukprot:6203665-Pleurochrysis_carterae.AAC.3
MFYRRGHDLFAKVQKEDDVQTTSAEGTHAGRRPAAPSAGSRFRHQQLTDARMPGSARTASVVAAFGLCDSPLQRVRLGDPASL